MIYIIIYVYIYMYMLYDIYFPHIFGMKNISPPPMPCKWSSLLMPGWERQLEDPEGSSQNQGPIHGLSHKYQVYIVIIPIFMHMSVCTIHVLIYIHIYMLLYRMDVTWNRTPKKCDLLIVSSSFFPWWSGEWSCFCCKLCVCTRIKHKTCLVDLESAIQGFWDLQHIPRLEWLEHSHHFFWNMQPDKFHGDLHSYLAIWGPKYQPDAMVFACQKPQRVPTQFSWFKLITTKTWLWW